MFALFFWAVWCARQGTVGGFSSAVWCGREGTQPAAVNFQDFL
jgi:hypothetical protein